MSKMRSSVIPSFPLNYMIFAILGMLLLLGSHLLDYYPWIFVVASLVFIDWRQVRTFETVLVTILLVSMYVTWYSLDKNIIYHTKYFGQGVLALTMFLLGLSLVKRENLSLSSQRTIFYLLFIFFIGYLLSLVYSYVFLDPVHPIDREGMYVCFQNEYRRIHMNNGNLISTVIAYYLSPMAVLLPFLILYFHTFKKVGFHVAEILFLSALSLFALFLAVQMQRRTVLLLFIISFGYLLAFKLIRSGKSLDFKKVLWTLVFLGIAMGIGYYFLADTPVIKRLIHEGLHDKRFTWWAGGIEAMWEYPFGGGYNVVLGNKTKLAHNLWIDIGKDFGVIPFITLMLLSLAFCYRLFHFLFFRKTDIFIKHLVVLISLVIFIVFMLEPVYNSDKTFFIYFMYFLGILVAMDQKRTISSE